MSVMEEILEPLVRSPRFLTYLDELNGFQRREAEARQRFRDSLSEDVREEFINGEVVRHMTARHSHNITISNLVRLLGAFVQIRRLGVILQEQSLTQFPRNDYAPDICFWGAAKSAALTGDTIIYPIPDFICEILSQSTERRDRGIKFEDYAAHGVAEYWLVDPDQRFIEQFFAEDGKYKLDGKFSSAVIRSKVITGFEMPVLAAFDDQANLDAWQKLRT
jgi:Uma2 family endonuclease